MKKSLNLKTGHLYFAQNRTFLLCVDSTEFKILVMLLNAKGAISWTKLRSSDSLHSFLPVVEAYYHLARARKIGDDDSKARITLFNEITTSTTSKKASEIKEQYKDNFGFFVYAEGDNLFHLAVRHNNLYILNEQVKNERGKYDRSSPLYVANNNGEYPLYLLILLANVQTGEAQEKSFEAIIELMKCDIPADFFSSPSKVRGCSKLGWLDGKEDVLSKDVWQALAICRDNWGAALRRLPVSYFADINTLFAAIRGNDNDRVCEILDRYKAADVLIFLEDFGNKSNPLQAVIAVANSVLAKKILSDKTMRECFWSDKMLTPLLERVSLDPDNEDAKEVIREFVPYFWYPLLSASLLSDRDYLYTTRCNITDLVLNLGSGQYSPPAGWISSKQQENPSVLYQLIALYMGGRKTGAARIGRIIEYVSYQDLKRGNQGYDGESAWAIIDPNSWQGKDIIPLFSCGFPEVLTDDDCKDLIRGKKRNAEVKCYVENRRRLSEEPGDLYRIAKEVSNLEIMDFLSSLKTEYVLGYCENDQRDSFACIQVTKYHLGSDQYAYTVALKGVELTEAHREEIKELGGDISTNFEVTQIKFSIRTTQRKGQEIIGWLVSKGFVPKGTPKNAIDLLECVKKYPKNSVGKVGHWRLWATILPEGGTYLDCMTVPAAELASYQRAFFARPKTGNVHSVLGLVFVRFDNMKVVLQITKYRDTSELACRVQLSKQLCQYGDILAELKCRKLSVAAEDFIRYEFNASNFLDVIINLRKAECLPAGVLYTADDVVKNVEDMYPPGVDNGKKRIGGADKFCCYVYKSTRGLEHYIINSCSFSGVGAVNPTGDDRVDDTDCCPFCFSPYWHLKPTAAYPTPYPVHAVIMVDNLDGGQRQKSVDTSGTTICAICAKEFVKLNEIKDLFGAALAPDESLRFVIQ